MKKSFSFTEIMFVVLIFSILVVILQGFVGSAFLGFDINITRLDLVEEIQNIWPLITQDIKEAKNFAISNGNKTLTLTYPDDSNIVYSLNDGQLIRNQAGNVQILSDMLDTNNSSFSDGGGMYSVLCTFVLQSNSFRGVITYRSQRNITLRNKV